MTLFRAPLIAAIAFSLLPSLAAAQHVQVLHDFAAPIGAPKGPLAETRDGSLYGVTTTEIFRRAPNGDVTWLNRFSFGDQIAGGLTLGSDGALYGATTNFRVRDTVFRVDPASGAVRTLHELAIPSEGTLIPGRLARVGSFLYGVTSIETTTQGWTIFRVSADTGLFETVYVQPNGQPPVGDLVAAGDALFMLFPVSALQTNWAYRFAISTRAVTVFASPDKLDGIVSTADGALYGWSKYSGPSFSDPGQVFQIDPTTGAFTTALVAPSSTRLTGTITTLVAGTDGHLYGTGAVNGPGDTFRLRRGSGGTHAFELLGSAPGLTYLSPASNGFIYGYQLFYPWILSGFDATVVGLPSAPLQLDVVFSFSASLPYRLPSRPVRATDGLLYGMTLRGGPRDSGAAYRLDPATGAVTILGDVPDYRSLFSRPFESDLVLGLDGNLYGTTVNSNLPPDAAVPQENRVLRLNPSTGVITVAAAQPVSIPGAAETFSPLTPSPSGALYGTARRMGRAEAFRFDPATDTLTTVAGMDIAEPALVQVTRLVLADDGSFYGALLVRSAFFPSFVQESRLFRVNESRGTLDLVAVLGSDSTVSNPVVGADGDLYVAAGLHVVAVNSATAAVREVCVLDPGGLVYGLARGPDDALYGFMGPAAAPTLFRCDPATGALARLQRLGGSAGTPETALALLADGFLYGGTTGALYSGDSVNGGRGGGGAIVRVAVNGALPDIDTDGDGLPNTWETTFGLVPSSATADGGPTGDPDGDGVTNAQELAAGTHPLGFATRYFAEGATGSFFRTRLSLFNPRSFVANVLLRFLTDTGTIVSHHLVLPGRSGQTIDVATLPGLASANFSTVIESDQPLAVDRTMSWDATGYGSHSETAVAAPSTAWYFAEGSTSGDFALFYLLQNPQATAVSATVRYLLPSGPPIVRTYTLAPHSRTTIQVDAQPGVESTDVSASITATAPIIAERAMYLSKPGQPFAAGHESAGVTTPVLEWFLAEGATGPFFDTFVLIANPSPTVAQVTVDYLLIGGGVLTRSYTVAANSRFTIWVDDEQIPAGSGQKPLANVAVSATVRSTNNVPIVVERTMWWPGPELGVNFWYEAHNSPGTTAPASRWAFADGEVGGASAAETYVLIANPAATAAEARVTVVFQGGATLAHDYTLEGKSRTNVPIGATFPSTANQRFGVVVESIGRPAPLVVERATYASPGGVTWASGTNALAASVP